jgi:hypothetical protein
VQLPQVESQSDEPLAFFFFDAGALLCIKKEKSARSLAHRWSAAAGPGKGKQKEKTD